MAQIFDKNDIYSVTRSIMVTQILKQTILSFFIMCYNKFGQ